MPNFQVTDEISAQITEARFAKTFWNQPQNKSSHLSGCSTILLNGYMAMTSDNGRYQKSIYLLPLTTLNYTYSLDPN